jgi:Cdc6-like AAA superfamily ATPase
MAMGFRPSRNLAADKRRNEMITGAVVKELEQLKQRLIMEDAKRQKHAMDLIFQNAKTTVSVLQNVDREVSGLNALQTQFNAGAKECLRQSKDNIKQQLHESQERLEQAKQWSKEANDNLKTAQDDLQRISDQAVQAKNSIPAPEIDRFIELSGGVLLRDGSKELDNVASKLLNASPPGGIIFIDEAGQLSSASQGNPNALSVVHRLIKLAEDHRDCLTIMLSGYKSQMDKLMESDPGLPSRFPKVFLFKDYNAQELTFIFKQLLANNTPQLILESDSMADVVGRRIAKNAGQEGFANARSVRNSFQSILIRNFRRRKEEEYASGVISTNPNPILDSDILGERPNPDESKAFQQLNSMIGLTAVKESVRELLIRLQVIWDCEKSFKVPPPVPFLNRVFVGNPGTGKTTVAKHYANILCETGFLSEGEVIFTSPADFLGLNSGESMSKTKAILEKSKGNVLVIDEAYGLMKPT